MKKCSYLGYNPIGFHRVSYTDWNHASTAKALLCVHGLTRNGRDFDYLARHLQKDFRVVCPDLVGRGESDWLPNPKLYDVPQYISDLIALMARIETDELNYLGTSLGGVLGILLAGSVNSPIKRLILNDVGPKIPSVSLLPIIKYTKANLSFASLEDLESYLRRVYAQLGPLSDEQWAHLIKFSHYQSSNGRYHYACDPGIIVHIMLATPRANLWPYWKAIRCPILVIHGAKSRVLTPAILEKMKHFQPTIEVIEIAEAGHAPSLMDTFSMDKISEWLERN